MCKRWGAVCGSGHVAVARNEDCEEPRPGWAPGLAGGRRGPGQGCSPEALGNQRRRGLDPVSLGAKEDGLPACPGVARQQLFPHSKLPRTQPDGTSIPGEPASPVSQRLPPKVESLESLYFTPIPARGQPPLESSLDSLGDVFLDSGRKTRSARRRTTQIINITMTKVSRWPGRPRPLRAPFPRVPERQAALTARPRGWAAELPSRAAVQASRGKGQGSRPRAGCRRQCGAAAAQQGLPAPPAGCPGGLLARLGLRSSLLVS